MEKISLLIKGFLIGLAKVIPGVSGGMLAISLGLYDKGIEAISHFFKNPKKNAIFLTVIGSGALVAILLFSKVIKFCLDLYYLPTMLLFIGLILGGMPAFLKNVKGKWTFFSTLLCLMMFASIVSLSFIKGTNAPILPYATGLKSFLCLIGVGMVDAASMIIPGISGTALLMLLGYYDPLMTVLSSLTNFANLSSNLTFLLPFGLGLILGALLFIKAMSYLLSHYPMKTYFAIIGFAMASLFLLFFDTIKTTYPVGTILVSLAFFVLGYQISRRLDRGE